MFLNKYASREKGGNRDVVHYLQWPSQVVRTGSIQMEEEKCKMLFM